MMLFVVADCPGHQRENNWEVAYLDVSAPEIRRAHKERKDGAPSVELLQAEHQARRVRPAPASLRVVSFPICQK